MPMDIFEMVKTDPDFSWKATSVRINELAKERGVNTLLRKIFAADIEEVRLNSPMFKLQYEHGVLGLPTMQPRGVNSEQQIPEGYRADYYFEVPHYALIDEIKADDFRNFAPLSSGIVSEEDRVTVAQVESEKMRIANNLFDFLDEFNLNMAIQGYVKNGIDTTFCDVYEEVGATRHTLEVNLGASNDKNPKDVFTDAVQIQKDELDSEMVSERVCICGYDFFKKMEQNKVVADSFDRLDEGSFLRRLHIEDGFKWGGINFVCQAQTSRASDGSRSLWIPTNCGFLVPRGLYKQFIEVVAPADYIDCVGKRADETMRRYAKSWPTEGEKTLKIEHQTNPFIFHGRLSAIVNLRLSGTTESTRPAFTSPVRNTSRR